MLYRLTVCAWSPDCSYPTLTHTIVGETQEQVCQLFEKHLAMDAMLAEAAALDAVSCAWDYCQPHNVCACCPERPPTVPSPPPDYTRPVPSPLPPPSRPPERLKPTPRPGGRPEARPLPTPPPPRGGGGGRLFEMGPTRPYNLAPNRPTPPPAGGGRFQRAPVRPYNLGPRNPGLKSPPIY